LLSAIFNDGMKGSAFALPANPAHAADKRREPHRGALVYYRVEEVEALARAFAGGRHRTPGVQSVSASERAAMRAEDAQDAEMVRVSAYAGLRLGELLALRWRDVDFLGRAITVGRAMSAGTETSTKSGRVRRVPLPDQAAAALDRVGRRGDFTDPDELVFSNALGRSLDPSALRRRYRRAQDAAGLRPLRWHDLRHTYRSLLAADGVDLVTIQTAMATQRCRRRGGTCTPGPPQCRRPGSRRCSKHRRRRPSRPAREGVRQGREWAVVATIRTASCSSHFVFRHRRFIETRPRGPGRRGRDRSHVTLVCACPGPSDRSLNATRNQRARAAQESRWLPPTHL